MLVLVLACVSGIALASASSGGNTNLTGAVIASAAPANDNSLTTGTLSFSNIQNSAQYTDSTSSAGFDSSAPLGSAALSGLGLLGGALGLGPSGSASGVTQSAIGAGTITVTNAAPGSNPTAGLSRDTADANGAIQQIFNLQKIENDQAVSQAFGQVANEIAGTVITQSHWDENSPQATLLHGIIGAVQGQLAGGSALAGAAGGAVSAQLAPVIANYLQSQGIAPGTDEYNQLVQAGTEAAGLLAGAAVGAASGSGAQSAAAIGGQSAFSAATYNYLSHDQLQKFIAALKSCGGDQTCQQQAAQTAEAESNTNSQNLSQCATAACFGSAIGSMASNGALVSDNLSLLNGTQFVTASGQSADVSTLVYGSPAGGGAYSDSDLAYDALKGLSGGGASALTAESILNDPTATNAEKAASLEQPTISFMPGIAGIAGVEGEAAADALSAAENAGTSGDTAATGTADSASGSSEAGNGSSTSNGGSGSGSNGAQGTGGGNSGTSASSTGQFLERVTPASNPGNVTGTPTALTGDASNQQALESENKTAIMLANDLGVNVEQNPETLPNGKNPDYQINGQYYDAYSPTTGNVQNIADAVFGKVNSGQASNIVINLSGSSANEADVAQYIQQNAPIMAPGTQNVLIYNQSGNLFKVVLH